MWKPGQIVTIPIHGENTKWRVISIDSCVKRTNRPYMRTFVAISVLMNIYKRLYPNVRKNLSQSDMICPLEAYLKTK